MSTQTINVSSTGMLQASTRESATQTRLGEIANCTWIVGTSPGGPPLRAVLWGLSVQGEPASVSVEVYGASL